MSCLVIGLTYKTTGYWCLMVLRLLMIHSSECFRESVAAVACTAITAAIRETP